MRNTRSKAYWAARSAALEAAAQNDATAAQNKLIAIYKRAIKNIEADIDNIFNEFARYRELTPEAAGELITAAENKQEYETLLMLLEEATAPEEIKEIEDKINAHAYGARISRLEGVKERVYTELRQAARAERAVVTALTSGVMQKAYYTTIHDTAKGLNCGVDFTLLPKRAIEKVQQADWFGSNYSARIWKNNGEFIQQLQTVIEDGITAGHSIDRMARRLEEFADDTSGKSVRYVTERLVRSETAHFMNEGTAEAYEEMGTETYIFLAALSERTCDVCGALDGQVFKVSERVPGSNYPIIHPNCRCTTITGDFMPSQRIARDPLTNKNYKVDGKMTYDEWKNSLTEEQRDAMALHVKQMRNKSADKKQYENYKSIIGAENMPKTFDKFVVLKYNDSEKWDELKYYYHNINGRPIEYVKIDREIEKLGLRNKGKAYPVENIEITGWRGHAENRMLGSGLTKDDAIKFKDNAIVVMKRFPEPERQWNYYSEDGIIGIKEADGVVQTVIGKDRYDENTNQILKVVRKWIK